MPPLSFIALENRADLHADVFALGFDPGAIGRGRAGLAGIIGLGVLERRLLAVEARPTERDVHLRNTGPWDFFGAINFHKRGVPRPESKVAAFEAQTSNFVSCATRVLYPAGEPGV